MLLHNLFEESALTHTPRAIASFYKKKYIEAMTGVYIDLKGEPIL